MEQNYTTPVEQPVENKGSLAKGILGALLGTILGAAIAGAVYIMLQETNTLLGFLMGFLIIKGYELLKGRKGAVKLVVCIICIVLGVVLAESIFYVSIIEKDFAEGVAMMQEYGITPDSPFYLTRADAYQLYFDDPEFFEAFAKDIGTSFVFVGATALLSVLGVYFTGKKKDEQPVDISAASVPGQTVDMTSAQPDAVDTPVEE